MKGKGFEKTEKGPLDLVTWKLSGDRGEVVGINVWSGFKRDHKWRM